MDILRWETRYRYYSARVYQDMFGDWVLAVAHGGKQNGMGAVRIHPAKSEADALKKVTKLAVRRVKRGYVQKAPQQEDHAAPQHSPADGTSLPLHRRSHP